MEDEQRNQMKTLLWLLSGLATGIALIAAWKVSPASAACLLFAFFAAVGMTFASFALRSKDPETRDALDGRKGGDK